MGLFSKKNLSFEEILESVEKMSDEEKQTLRLKLQGKTVGDNVENAKEETNEKTKEIDEKTEEISEGVEENAESAEEATEASTAEEAVADGEQPSVEKTTDDQAQENCAEMVKALADRVTALEEGVKEFSELKARMEEFTQKQAEAFGYKGAIPGTKKDVRDMSADELKASIIKGI